MTGGVLTAINSVNYYVYTLTTNAQNLAKKLLRGQTSYRVRSPVVRASTETFNLPATNPCDKIENPPSAANPPAGYVYVRSAQRGVKTGRYGKWKQEQEWEGATEVDTDIYPNA